MGVERYSENPISELICVVFQYLIAVAHGLKENVLGK
jgi:hypothetical protein